MSFTWTKLFRSYDIDKFTGTDSGVDGDPNRYSYVKQDGTRTITDQREKFMMESEPSFLGYHTNDMRSAFPFRKFEDLEQAKTHFNLEPHPVHSDRVMGVRFALHDEHSLKMTIEFYNKQDWQSFVEVNHDGQEPITHGMKQFQVNWEYDKDYPGRFEDLGELAQWV
tara:strand:- start:1107 stop:1607 length:501 start_codon:yes stop_codon:yes gene_type:complete